MSITDLIQNEPETGFGDRITGVVVGVVTDNKDPEHLGRVKISFPWRYECSDSNWARVTSPMAGNGRGVYFLPEVDDEVLVAFDRGDINYPYIIGALWSKTDKPPEANDNQQNNIRKIRSRSGHEIILDDTTGQERIEIRDQTGCNMVTIDSAKNAINIECAMELKIKANIIEIEGTGSLTIKSDGVLTIKGSLVQIN